MDGRLHDRKIRTAYCGLGFYNIVDITAIACTFCSEEEKEEIEKILFLLLCA